MTYGGGHSHVGGGSGAHTHGSSGSGDGCGAFVILIIGVMVVGGIIGGAIFASVHRHSVTSVEDTAVTLKQEGISARIRTSAHLDPCSDCSFLNATYSRRITVSLRNSSNETHTVIVCGPIVRTKNWSSSSYGPDCFWFRLRPGRAIKTTINGKLALQETQGFRVVNPGGVEAVDNHPVVGAPLKMGYSDDQSSTIEVCNNQGCNPPSPGIKG